jgi:hypothetical protein
MPSPLQQLLLPPPRPTLCSQDGAPSRLRLATPHCRRANTPPPNRAAVLPLLPRRQADVLPLLLLPCGRAAEPPFCLRAVVPPRRRSSMLPSCRNAEPSRRRIAWPSRHQTSLPLLPHQLVAAPNRAAPRPPCAVDLSQLPL